MVALASLMPMTSMFHRSAEFVHDVVRSTSSELDVLIAQDSIRALGVAYRKQSVLNVVEPVLSDTMTHDVCAGP